MDRIAARASGASRRQLLPPEHRGTEWNLLICMALWRHGQSNRQILR
jgi:hypothetical protein